MVSAAAATSTIFSDTAAAMGTVNFMETPDAAFSEDGEMMKAKAENGINDAVSIMGETKKR